MIFGGLFENVVDCQPDKGHRLDVDAGRNEWFSKALRRESGAERLSAVSAAAELQRSHPSWPHRNVGGDWLNNVQRTILADNCGASSAAF